MLVWHDERVFFNVHCICLVISLKKMYFVNEDFVQLYKHDVGKKIRKIHPHYTYIRKCPYTSQNIANHYLKDLKSTQ